MTKMEQKIISTIKSRKKPVTKADLTKRVYGYKENRKDFNSALSTLIAQGTIVENKGRYGLVRSQKNLIEGEVVKVLKTFGFVTPTSKEGKDIFVPGKFLMGSMPGDKVLVKPLEDQRGDSTEGEVVKIIEKTEKTVIGVIVRDKKSTYFIPDQLSQLQFSVDKSSLNNIPSGSKVSAQLVKRGKRHSEHMVKIIESFGEAESAATNAKAVLSDKGIITEFPPEVTEQARAIATGVGIHPKEIAQRDDLRDWNIFTIDGPDTKDIDDAISLTKTDSGWQLGVHIADVSYYVTRQSPLDKEAFSRGNSVYYANQVIPMLPKELSNGICSLNPNEERLAFSALVNLDNEGNILNYDFKKTAINSKIKGVYGEINQILENEADDEILEKYKDQIDVLKNMQKLAKLLNERRQERGSINLESTESKIIIDENQNIVDIVNRQSGLSENMIEEFMLVANEAAASFATKQELPFVYRVHEEPSEDRAEKLFELMDKLGVSYKRPKENESYKTCFNQILEQVKGTNMAEIVNYSLLRTMAKAKYSEDNLGHFGLALKNYAHFTSPIRRYSDLTIHRILTGKLTGMRKENIEKYFRNWVSESALQSTKQEMAAMSAEREIEDCYKAEYMSKFINEEFDGRISSVTGFGLFVELPNTVEGLLRSSELPGGGWVFDGVLSYNSEKNAMKLSLGDSVRVKVVKVEVSSGSVDFKIVE